MSIIRNIMSIVGIRKVNYSSEHRGNRNELIELT